VLGYYDEEKHLQPAGNVGSGFDDDTLLKLKKLLDAITIKKSPFYNKTVPVCPAEIDSAMKDKLSEVALRAHNAIGCLDYARVDMRLDSRGRIGVLEVNPNPDISEEAGFARAARAAGIVYPELIEKIVSIAEARYSEDEIKGGWEDETPPARCGEA